MLILGVSLHLFYLIYNKEKKNDVKDQDDENHVFKVPLFNEVFTKGNQTDLFHGANTNHVFSYFLTS